MENIVKNLTDTLKKKEQWDTPALIKIVEGWEKLLLNNLKQITRAKSTAKVIYRTKYVTLKKIAKGDILSLNLGGITHPGIVWKIRDNICYCLTMSTTEALHNLHKIENSRLFSDFITKTVVEVKMEHAMKQFVTVFDNRKELITIFAKAKEYYKTLIK